MSKRRIVVIGGLLVLVVGGYVVADRYGYRGRSAPVAQAPQRRRRRAWSPVEVATAVKKSTPVQIEALGTVTPMASVAIKARVDSEIIEVHFADGARVKQGDLLITLDSRAIEAQILQVEGNIARDKAQLEGAERDVRRYTELVAKNATPVTNLDNAKTQVAVYAPRVKADEAMLEESAGAAQLRHDPRADLRPHQRGRRQGRQFRALRRPAADRHHHPDRAGLRHLPGAAGLAAGAARGARARAPRASMRSFRARRKRAVGRIAMIENTVDAATGMVNVRATMPNEDELLWPGTLVQT